MQEPMPFDGTRMISGGFSAPARRARRRVANRGVPMKKNTICLWYDHDAEEAARFYARTFPDSTVGAVHRAPSDFPGGKAGDVLTVEFTVCGVPCLGSMSKHGELIKPQRRKVPPRCHWRPWPDTIG